MKRHACLRHAVPGAVLLAAAATVHAETSPYYIGVSQAYSYNSNVFRLPDAFAESSGWSTTSLVGGFDQPYGRQRFYANGNVAANIYQQLDELDNTSYGLTAGWDWATIERLSGKLYLNVAQNLGNYGGANDTLIRTKNIEDSQLFTATVDYGLVSLWTADARFAYSNVSYSAPEYAQYELRQRSASLGVRRQFGGQLTMGTGLTYTDGAYKAIGRWFDRYDAYLSADWTATGQSVLRGRLNYSSWEYTGLNPYDTSGITGWATWEYTPTGKLAFTTTFSYDTLANSSLTPVGGGAPGGLGDNNELTTALKLGVSYAATGKINITAALDYYTRKRDYSVNPPPGLPPSTLETRDRVTNVSLGANWTPSRNWLVNCNVTSNNRNQDANQPITLTPYKALGGSCAVQYVLQ